MPRFGYLRHHSIPPARFGGPETEIETRTVLRILRRSQLWLERGEVKDEQSRAEQRGVKLAYGGGTYLTGSSDLSRLPYYCLAARSSLL